jgi:Ca2+-binding RTX toxin-like protein
VFGKATGFGSAFDLSTLDGANGFRIDGTAPRTYAGTSVSSAGDVNGDGYADMIVGGSQGTNYVVFGKAFGFADVFHPSSLNGHNGFTIVDTLNEHAGFSVSLAGDVNGDGFDDLIVGAYTASLTVSLSGAAFVVFGAASGFGATFDVASIDGNNGFAIDGVAQIDNTGFSVAAGGDVNGDGFDDIVVGAQGSDINGNGSGAAYVIYGSTPGEAVTRIGTGIANDIHGGNFDDTLSGLGGNDTLTGYDGDDTIYGADGNDRVIAGAGDDVVFGGSGNDRLNGAGDTDSISGGSGNDKISGGGGSDTIAGDSGNDKMKGQDGSDVLSGGDGNDSLKGGDGDDVLTGGDGKDALNGGVGVDRFVFKTAGDSTSVNFDIATNADFAADVWDVPSAVKGIDATITSGLLSNDHFDTKRRACRRRAPWRASRRNLHADQRRFYWRYIPDCRPERRRGLSGER